MQYIDDRKEPKEEDWGENANDDFEPPRQHKDGAKAPSVEKNQLRFQGLFDRGSDTLMWDVAFRNGPRSHDDERIPSGFPEITMFYKQARSLKIFEWAYKIYKALYPKMAWNSWSPSDQTHEPQLLRAIIWSDFKAREEEPLSACKQIVRKTFDEGVESFILEQDRKRQPINPVNLVPLEGESLEEACKRAYETQWKNEAVELKAETARLHNVMNMHLATFRLGSNAVRKMLVDKLDGDVQHLVNKYEDACAASTDACGPTANDKADLARKLRALKRLMEHAIEVAKTANKRVLSQWMAALQQDNRRTVLLKQIVTYTVEQELWTDAPLAQAPAYLRSLIKQVQQSVDKNKSSASRTPVPTTASDSGGTKRTTVKRKAVDDGRVSPSLKMATIA